MRIWYQTLRAIALTQAPALVRLVSEADGVDRALSARRPVRLRFHQRGAISLSFLMVLAG
ncbi:MAG: hypothetical protein ACFCVB_14655 [Nodosilinea sp.]